MQRHETLKDIERHKVQKVRKVKQAVQSRTVKTPGQRTKSVKCKTKNVANSHLRSLKLLERLAKCFIPSLSSCVFVHQLRVLTDFVACSCKTLRNGAGHCLFAGDTSPVLRMLLMSSRNDSCKSSSEFPSREARDAKRRIQLHGRHPLFDTRTNLQPQNGTTQGLSHTNLRRHTWHHRVPPRKHQQPPRITTPSLSRPSTGLHNLRV